VEAGKFFWTPGNHDWLTNPDTPSVNYFRRPNHYVAHLAGGLVDLFVTDMNPQDPDGDSATSKQAQEYRAAVQSSAATWKITTDHQAFFSSGQHGTQSYTHWAIMPQIDLFLSGHDHDMEHLAYQGQNFVVNGVGGRNLYGFPNPPCPNSSCPATTVWRDGTAPYHFGAVRLTVGPTSLKVEFVGLSSSLVTGQVLHTFTLQKSAYSPQSTPTPTSSPTPGAPAPASQPSGQGSLTSCNLAPPIRAAFYYPWYSENWTQSHRYPAAAYQPALGYYGDDLSVLQSQIGAMRYGNLRAGIVSWWGQGTRTDSRVPLLLDAAHKSGFCWTLYYEPEGQADPPSSRIASDLAYIAKRYSADPGFLRVGGRPVLFVYDGNGGNCRTAQRWQEAQKSAGTNFYINEQVFAGYRKCPIRPDSWHQYAPAVAADHQVGYSYTISPGFNKWSEPSPRLARAPSRWQQGVQDMVSSGEPWQLVTTFNEWQEGTAVEAATQWQSSSGYGTYLDALHSR
jgi:glycosyl hydrolase family 99